LRTLKKFIEKIFNLILPEEFKNTENNIFLDASTFKEKNELSSPREHPHLIKIIHSFQN
jgi:hypothetical protein